MTLKSQIPNNLTTSQKTYIEETIAYFKSKNVNAAILISTLHDEYNRVGETVTICDEERTLIKFSVLCYPFCCGASILMDVDFSYKTQREDMEVVNNYIYQFNKVRSKATCQFMSSYDTHRNLHTYFLSLGWKEIYKYHNINSGNKCFIIVKDIE